MKNKNLNWKLLGILAVVALAVFAFYPPQQKVKLGLDLKGGVHLILRVQTDDALKLETDLAGERLREDLVKRNVTIGAIATDAATRFRVDGVQQAHFQLVRFALVKRLGDRLGHLRTGQHATLALPAGPASNRASPALPRRPISRPRVSGPDTC